MFTRLKHPYHRKVCDMKNHLLIITVIMLLALLAGCGAEKEDNTTMIGGADGSTSIYLSPPTEGIKDTADTENIATEDTDTGKSKNESVITDEQAVAAIRNYCYINNSDLEGIVNEGEYPVYWDISASDENEIVVVFRSYTGALNYYYIDPVSGDTYVTELVPGIIDEEQRTDETFNVKDYMVDPETASDKAPAITGTWQTASMVYEEDGTIYPEYYVQFTDTEIKYGHMKDGVFAIDHSDKINLMEQTANGGYKIQAMGSNGVQYTYQTAESDKDILEYYETWKEDEYPDAYRGGASLSKCD